MKKRLSLSRRTSFAALMQLSVWQMGKNKGLVGSMAVGLLLAVALLCLVPLYSQVMMSAGLRAYFSPISERSFLAVSTTAHTIPSENLNVPQFALNSLLQQYLPQYIDPKQAQLSIRADFSNPLVAGQPALSARTSALRLVGEPGGQFDAHIELVQGRLPLARQDGVEFLLTPQSAAELHFSVGETIQVPLDYSPLPGVVEQAGSSLSRPPAILKLYLVGLFLPRDSSDIFWHGQSWQADPATHDAFIPALVATEPFLATCESLQTRANEALENLQLFYNNDGSNPGLNENWYYRFDGSHLDVQNLPGVIADFQAFDTVMLNTNAPSFQALSPTTELQSYAQRLQLATLPTTILSVLIGGLVLLFVSLIVDLFIDHQASEIAVLRSRGASRVQIFSIFTLQCGIFSLGALVLGPLVAFLCIPIMVHVLLAPEKNTALDVIQTHPWQTLWDIRWYALAATCAGFGTVILSISSALHLDMLRLRMQQTRPKKAARWQRFSWEIAALLLATVAYLVARSLNYANILDARTNLLLYTPFILSSSILLLVALAFAFLRLVPHLLRAVARGVSRRASASFMLALEHLARTPARALHVILLLVLTTSFGTFALVCLATQAQRSTDIAQMETGADFQGRLPLAYTDGTGNTSPLEMDATYRSLPGVQAATAGYSGALLVPGASALSTAQLRAVDSAAFARTVAWAGPEQATYSSLLAQLRADHAGNALPAMIDSATSDALHLSLNQLVSLRFGDMSLTLRVVARVQQIPSIVDAPDGSQGGGILVDYQRFRSLFSAQTLAPALNTIWLRTDSADASLTRLRAILANPSDPHHLEHLFDRRALAADFYQEPLSLLLIGVLGVGVLTPLVLALLGNLLSAWLELSARQTQFALLRALGFTAAQMDHLLNWEQGIIYGLALGFGTLSGLTLALLSAPALVFTSVPTSDAEQDLLATNLYQLQNTPPLHLIIPASLALGLAIFITIGVLALRLMLRVAMQRAPGQMLRLNED